jgi:hypothetical protein
MLLAIANCEYIQYKYKIYNSFNGLKSDTYCSPILFS